MTDADLWHELLLVTVEWLTEPFQDQPPQRLEALLVESRSRWYRNKWAGCTCQECMRLVPDAGEI